MTSPRRVPRTVALHCLAWPRQAPALGRPLHSRFNLRSSGVSLGGLLARFSWQWCAPFLGWWHPRASSPPGVASAAPAYPTSNNNKIFIRFPSRNVAAHQNCAGPPHGMWARWASAQAHRLKFRCPSQSRKRPARNPVEKRLHSLREKGPRWPSNGLEHTRLNAVEFTQSQAQHQSTALTPRFY